MRIWSFGIQTPNIPCAQLSFPLLIFQLIDCETRSRRKWFSSRTRSLHTKACCSPDRWSRRYFAGVRSTTALRIRSSTRSHREHFSNLNTLTNDGFRSQLSTYSCYCVIVRPVIKSPRGHDVLYGRMERIGIDIRVGAHTRQWAYNE
jgi:hypothetical protein